LRYGRRDADDWIRPKIGKACLGVGFGRRPLYICRHLYSDEISAQPDDKANNGHGENKEEKHNPTLITGEDFALPTFIVRRFSFPLHVLLSRGSVDEARERRGKLDCGRR
jgi:hypothetical protein